VTAGVYLFFFYLSLLYVSVLVGLFVWAIYCFVLNNWPVLWPLKMLRSMGSLSATTLFIPLLYLLVSGFSCGDKVSTAARGRAEASEGSCRARHL
jgi:hypothetical protein